MTVPETEQSQKSLNLLILEDREDDVLLLVRQLRKGGYDLAYHAVATPGDFRNALEERSWDLIIADYLMPELTALSALEILGEYDRDTPFIILSGSIGEDLAVEAMKAGAHDYIMKDNTVRLVPAITRELREAGERRARRQAEELLRYQATHDSLTGLVNRREFEKRLEQALEAVRRDDTRYVLAYLDLDQFKIVNDVCGHAAGDMLLQQVCGLLQSRCRPRDVLGRLGGDELGLLMRDVSLEEARNHARELVETLRYYRFHYEAHLFVIGVNVGLVPVLSENGTPEDILKYADAACYVAKTRGPNQIYLFQTDDRELQRRQTEMQWVSRIHRTFEEDRLRLYYQEIRDLARGRPEGVEILIRMLDENGEVVPAGQFVPAAERYHLTTKIDKWVIETLFKEISINGLLDRLPGDTIHVNLSGQSLSQDDFLDFVSDQFYFRRVPAEVICFEITETAAISHLSRALHFIDELRRRGCCFALDDFGSGLSSFAYLKTLPIQYLKIDGAFVAGMLDHPLDGAIVQAINEVAHAMGARTIAEYVENDAVLEKLETLGVDAAQGFSLHRPEAI